MSRKTKWLISVRQGTKQKDLMIETEGDETPQETYKRARNKVTKIEQLLQGQGKVYLISRTVAFKPKGEKPHKHRYWCPYCNSWRIFLWDETFCLNRCSICGISDSDYYVRKYNGLWDKELLGKVKPRKPKM